MLTGVTIAWLFGVNIGLCSIPGIASNILGIVSSNGYRLRQLRELLRDPHFLKNEGLLFPGTFSILVLKSLISKKGTSSRTWAFKGPLVHSCHRH